MPSLAQLQSERWWNEEVVTLELDWLGDELCRVTGRPRNAAGAKGDTVHLRGAHRSQDWIVHSRFCTNRAYTVQAGLRGVQLRQVAGLDFTPGSVQDMIAQSRRLRSAMIAGQLDEVLEFYGNIDGDHIVDGWDNLHDRAATSDASHLWHWHLTLDRRHLNNKALMQRILNTVLGTGATMAITPADVTAIAEGVKNIRTGMSATSPGATFAQLLLGTVKTDQIVALDAKLTSLLAQVGALTTAVANLQHAVDRLSIVPVAINPVALSGELRFNVNPT